LEAIEACLQHATATGEGRAIGHAEHAAAVLYNGLGRYQAALAAAQRACEHEDLGVFGWALVELTEAGARSGTREIAAAALDRLAERARASSTEWALGIEARPRALLSDGQVAEALYREGIKRLARTRIAVHLARAHLLYGEWLRRENRRVDARQQLRAAHEMFSRIGAEAFAERAECELLATGEPPANAPWRPAELTAQEAQVARLARDGLSNLVIGARLVISPRTVQYHLRKVFTKLGINSRVQLDRVLPSDPNIALAGLRTCLDDTTGFFWPRGTRRPPLLRLVPSFAIRRRSSRPARPSRACCWRSSPRGARCARRRRRALERALELAEPRGLSVVGLW